MDRIRASIRGALFVSRLVVVFSFFASAWKVADAAPACPPDHTDEIAVIKHVYDGDTVLLADGRKLRLIGVNTPELGVHGAATEPFAAEAAAELRAQLQPRAEIRLRFDEQRMDRYGRVLAHTYTRAGASVTAELLERGYGVALAVPPNLWNSACYQAAEQRARDARRGVWGLSGYVVTDAGSLRQDTAGFHVLTGRVRKAVRTDRSLNLYLDGRIVVRILAGDLQYFESPMLAKAPAYLQGRKIEVRGWLRPYGKHLYLRIRHPAALAILE